jgi:hypothetical protein
VVEIIDETRRELERIYEAHNPEEQPFDLAKILQQQDLPEWQQQMLLEADQVEAQYGSRYIGVPHADSHEGYRDMEDFVVTVEDERLQDQLWQAISGRGAFRRFRDVLVGHFREQERWYAFKDARLEQRVLDWLASEDIEPIIEPSPVEESGPLLPSKRARLIAEVLPFVRAASRLPGVLRIALIGSLTTDEPNPKDADMLVTVTDDADLAPVAKLGRKLQGHAQGFNRGGEVSEEDVVRLVESLRADALVVPGDYEVSGVSPDPDDDKFLACALEAQADCIVSGDPDLLDLSRYRGIDILNPREFGERLR